MRSFEDLADRLDNELEIAKSRRSLVRLMRSILLIMELILSGQTQFL